MLDAALREKLDKVTLISDLLFLVDINGYGVTCGLCAMMMRRYCIWCDLWVVMYDDDEILNLVLLMVCVVR